MCGSTGTSNDDTDTAFGSAACVVHHAVGGAVRRHHRHFTRHTQFTKDALSTFHHRQVTCAALDDAYRFVHATKILPFARHVMTKSCRMDSALELVDPLLQL